MCLVDATLADDELLHDLVGAAVDGVDAGVGEHAGDWVLPHVAPAAKHLEALGADLVVLVSHPVLGH